MTVVLAAPFAFAQLCPVPPTIAVASSADGGLELWRLCQRRGPEETWRFLGSYSPPLGVNPRHRGRGGRPRVGSANRVSHRSLSDTITIVNSVQQCQRVSAKKRGAFFRARYTEQTRTMRVRMRI